MDDSYGESEVAYIRQQLEAEYEAMVRELMGLATGAAAPDCMNAHIQQICHYQWQLSQHVSNIEAAQIVTATYARAAGRDLAGGNMLTPTEDELDGGLWMLTYEDGFSYSWFLFYAPSWEEAIAYVRQLIAYLPYEVINTRLQAYPGGSSVML